jgi:hypothetical protein
MRGRSSEADREAMASLGQLHPPARWLLGAASALLALAVLLMPTLRAEMHRQADTEREVVRLFRHAEAMPGADEQVRALRELLADRFPAGAPAATLTAFLGDGGDDWIGRCEAVAQWQAGRSIYCHVSHGSLVAMILGVSRWRYREWVIGITLAPDTNDILKIDVRVPMLGKG